ncbi:MAG: hypothetical protein JJ992_04745, partial [Planctomycetes bacterium]|nr:hypothetical protein [Planctomycetota bacterium]
HPAVEPARPDCGKTKLAMKGMAVFDFFYPESISGAPEALCLIVAAIAAIVNFLWMLRCP